jgi:hypothetical protein
MNLSMKTRYMLAYQWALEKESDPPRDEITARVSVITDYLDFVWKHKPGRLLRKPSPKVRAVPVQEVWDPCLSRRSSMPSCRQPPVHFRLYLRRTYDDLRRIQGKESRMDKHRQEEIIKALESKKAIQPCPRCQNKQFEVIGEAGIPLAPERGASWFGPAPAIPVILVSCNNCGYIAHHATGLLGLARRS